MKIIFITIIPFAGAENTDFEFMYWVDGIESNMFSYIYKNVFRDRD